MDHNDIKISNLDQNLLKECIDGSEKPVVIRNAIQELLYPNGGEYLSKLF